jgi:hypothetical protein
VGCRANVDWVDLGGEEEGRADGDGQISRVSDRKRVNPIPTRQTHQFGPNCWKNPERK